MRQNAPIIVTGANGLAGSAVVEHLRNLAFTNVVGLTRDDADLRNHHHVAKVFKEIRPKYVFHAAATVYGLLGNMEHQGKALLDNTLINTSVIDAAHTCGSVRKITVMGTNAIYPWPTPLPFAEANIYTGRPDKGEFGYGHAKRHMLAMLEAYQQSYGLEYTYLVSGNLYGPRDKFDPINGHVLPSLIYKFSEAKHANSIVPIWGDGSATRDFLYSKDLAHFVSVMMDEENFFRPGAINIGSGQRVSIKRLAETLSEISGVPMDRVKFDTSKPTGRPDCYSDLTKLDALGLHADYDIAEGLDETWGWFEKNRAWIAA